MTDLMTAVKTEVGANILVQGDPGAGKTTMLAKLSNKYKLFVVCTSPNMQLLAQQAPNPANIQVVQIKDPGVVIRNGAVALDQPGNRPIAWPRIEALTQRWSADVPPYNEWDESYVLAVDDVTALGDDQDSPARIQALYNANKLGVIPGPSDNMRVTGEAGGLVTRWLQSFLNRSDRRFHVIVNVHLKRLSYDVGRYLEPEEIKSRAKKGEAHKLPMDSISTYEKYPVVCGRAPSETFLKNFTWAVHVVREGGAPVCYLTPKTPDWDVRLRTPLGPKHPFMGSGGYRLGVNFSGDTALENILAAHLELFGKNPQEKTA